MAVTNKDLKFLIDNTDIVKISTGYLISLTTQDFAISLHPGYLRDYLKKELDANDALLIKRDTAMDSSFASAVYKAKLSDLFAVTTSDYPALFQNHGESLSVLTFDYLKHLTQTYQLNTNMLIEIASILNDFGHTPWFPVPSWVPASDIDKRNAVRDALREAINRKPNLFLREVSEKLYKNGFKEKDISKDETLLILQELLRHES